MKIKVAVLQYNTPEDPIESVAKLSQMVEDAARQGARLVVAPETAIGDGGLAKNNGIDYFPQLSAIAKQNEVYLVSSIYRQENGVLANQGYIIAPNGQPILEQKKIYLAKPEIDDLGAVAGSDLSVTKSEVGSLGMLICKDGFNRYSHFLYQRLADLGVEIICVPAWSIGWKDMFTEEYVKHLYTYGAFASRAFVLMSDCTNEAFNSYGRSLIVSPIQGVLAEGSTDQEEILTAVLDLDEVKKAREFDSWWQPKINQL